MKKKLIQLLVIFFCLLFTYSLLQAQQKIDLSGVSRSGDLPGSTTYINPLGLLQFGPMLGKELLVGPALYADVHFRYSALGVLYQLIESDGFLNNVSWGSAAIGTGVRYFMPNTLNSNRFYVGGITELGWGATHGDIDTQYEWKGVDFYIDIMGNFGYRWRYPTGFFLNVGLFAGFAPTIKDTWWYISDPGTTYNGQKTLFFIGMLELSLGWEKK